MDCEVGIVRGGGLGGDGRLSFRQLGRREEALSRTTRLSPPMIGNQPPIPRQWRV